MFTTLILISAWLNVASSVIKPATCQPLLKADAYKVAYLHGNYLIVGSSQNSGRAYTGWVRFTGDERATSLDVSGKKEDLAFQGTAQYVACGPDKIEQLEVKLNSSETTYYCKVHANYTNLHRLSCSDDLFTHGSDVALWYQRLN
tara:strand:+ start:5181 stop:5615 length:435 start_codon:yes stop_codon:yes gene_type:complete